VIEGSIFMRVHNTVYRRYVTGLRLALTTHRVAGFYVASDIKDTPFTGVASIGGITVNQFASLMSATYNFRKRYTLKNA
jgi:hypothetical protein